MNHSEVIGKIAAVIALIAIVPYIRSMIAGKTRPNRASWFIWAAVSISIVASYHYSGATSTIWLALAYAILPCIVLLLSFKYGEGGLNKLDLVCIAGAILGLGVWKATNNAAYALYLNILVDAIGFIPTAKKAYFDPASENQLAWNISVLANVVNMFAITAWQLHIIVLPLYSLVCNLFVAVILFMRGGQKMKKSKAR